VNKDAILPQQNPCTSPNFTALIYSTAFFTKILAVKKNIQKRLTPTLISVYIQSNSGILCHLFVIFTPSRLSQTVTFG